MVCDIKSCASFVFFTESQRRQVCNGFDFIFQFERNRIGTTANGTEELNAAKISRNHFSSRFFFFFASFFVVVNCTFAVPVICASLGATKQTMHMLIFDANRINHFRFRYSQFFFSTDLAIIYELSERQNETKCRLHILSFACDFFPLLLHGFLGF